MRGDNFFPPTLIPLITFCSNRNKKLILCFDSNAHGTLWGQETNTLGEAIEDLLAQYNLKLENTGQNPTFKTRGTQTSMILH